MVCKELEELCAKFGSLSPHVRIDYIYGMLRMCLPPEVRFIGSLVEDLAKKDFNFLREHENRANNQIELKKYCNVDEKTLIEGMAFNLSLLHSVNTACANIIFGLLQENLKSAFLISNVTDYKTIDIILLVLTMAKYHPAFTFHQRTTIADYYKKVEQQLHDICAKHKTVSNDPESHMPPQCYSCSAAQTPQTPQTRNPVTPASHQKAFISQIDVKEDKTCRRHDRKHEYRIQVQWSNGDTTEASKTYQELTDFHHRVCKQCQIEEDISRTDKIAFYLGSPHKDETQDNDNQFATIIGRHLLNVPRSVQETDYFQHFFNKDTLTIETSETPEIPVMSDDKPKAGDLVGVIPPIVSASYFGSSFRPPVYQSPQSSNQGSPITSRSASPGDPVDNKTSVENKSQPMKYKNITEKDQVSLDQDMLSKEKSVNTVDAERIVSDLEENISEKSPNLLPNGMVEPCIPGTSLSHYQPWPYIHPPPPPVYHHPYTTCIIKQKELSSSENSPAPSPVPQRKTDHKGIDSSSDDSEKGNRVGSPYLESTRKNRHPTHREEDSRYTPPQGMPHGPSGCSGYQSDPTQGPFVRVIVPNNSYLAQPPQNNLNLSGKTVITLPDNIGGRRIGLAFPYQRCDTQTTTVTSNSSTTGPEFNRRPLIQGQYPFIRSPTMGGNNRNYMCTVTNSTTPVTAANLQSNANSSMRSSSSMASSVSEPFLSTNQNKDNQNDQGAPTSNQQANGNPVTCSALNGHSTSNHSQCLSCGCTGGHSMPPYQYHSPNQYVPNHMIFPPFMNATPNGIVHHPIYHHPFQYPVANGIHPNYFQAVSHHPAFSNAPGAQYGYFPPVIAHHRDSTGYNSAKQVRSITCSNCGSTDHVSSECRESSMESMSASFHLKYDPKSNSD